MPLPPTSLLTRDRRHDRNGSALDILRDPIWQLSDHEFMTGSAMGFGRPGRRADVARELHEALERRGIDLLPGRARQMLDERVAEVAAQMRISEQTALSYLPPDWAEQIAADIAIEHEQAHIAEETAQGSVPVSVTDVGALIAGLAVCVQNAVWRAMGNALPVSVGEPLDCLTGLALALQPAIDELEVPRAELIAAARHLGSESDALGRGHASPDTDPEQLARVVTRLASDAALAREIAR